MNVSDTPGTLSVTATFSDESRARAAITHLRVAGFPAASVSIARRPVHPPPEAPTLARVFWSGFWWSVAGALLGVTVGLIVGGMGWGVPRTPDNIAIQVAAWAMLAHVLGALVGCYAALDTGDRFALKPDHHDPPAILLRFAASDQQARARAWQLMREAGAVAID